MLHLGAKSNALGDLDLSGNLTRQVETDLPVDSDASHIANIGRLVEDMELKMRTQLRMPISSTLPRPALLALLTSTEEVYFGKAKDVVGELRSMLMPPACVVLSCLAIY